MLEDRAPGPSGASASNPTDAGKATRRLGWLRLVPELVTLCFCVALWIPTNDFTSSVGGPGPAMYPRILIGLLAIAMTVRIFQQVRENRSDARAAQADDDVVPEEGVEFDASLIDSRKVWLAVALSVAYVFGTIYLGWLIATFAFTIVFLVMAGKRKPLIIVPTALVFAFGLTYVFVKIVYVSLPTGVGVFDIINVRLFELTGIY